MLGEYVKDKEDLKEDGKSYIAFRIRNDLCIKPQHPIKELEWPLHEFQRHLGVI